MLSKKQARRLKGKVDKTKAFLREISLEDVLLVVGMVLVTVALWPLAERWFNSGRVALLPIGGILVYMALPQRSVFLRRGQEILPPRPRTR